MCVGRGDWVSVTYLFTSGGSVGRGDCVRACVCGEGGLCVSDVPLH